MIVRIRKLLLMPFDCRWNAEVRHWTAETERMIWNMRGGERGFRKRFCRDYGVCLEQGDMA